jgi:hypothetical protein
MHAIYFQLLKWRHKIQTVSEILVPTLLFIGIVAIRTEGGPSITPVEREAVVNRSITYPELFCRK